MKDFGHSESHSNICSRGVGPTDRATDRVYGLSDALNVGCQLKRGKHEKLLRQKTGVSYFKLLALISAESVAVIGIDDVYKTQLEGEGRKWR